MQVNISLPTRKLKAALDQIIKNILVVRKQGIDLAMKTFKLKKIDISNPMMQIASTNEIDDEILPKHTHNALYLGTVKAKKDTLNNFVKINFFLVQSTKEKPVNGEAYVDHLEIHIASRSIFKNYEEMLGLLFHEIKHFLQVNKISDEYTVNIPRLHASHLQKDQNERDTAFSIYHTDIAEFETTLTELITVIYYNFLRVRRKSKQWTVLRSNILKDLQQIIHCNAADIKNLNTTTLPAKLQVFFKSISLSKLSNTLWPYVQTSFADLYQRLSNTY
jgi:hypothetical protein